MSPPDLYFFPNPAVKALFPPPAGDFQVLIPPGGRTLFDRPTRGWYVISQPNQGVVRLSFVNQCWPPVRYLHQKPVTTPPGLFFCTSLLLTARLLYQDCISSVPALAMYSKSPVLAFRPRPPSFVPLLLPIQISVLLICRTLVNSTNLCTPFGPWGANLVGP